MSDSGSSLGEAVARGERLSVVLEPETRNSDLKHRRPRYIETYSLPHVCVQSGQVWGATRRTHLVHKPKDRIDSVVGFLYTDAMPLYGLFSYLDEMGAIEKKALIVKLLSARQYRSLILVTRPAGACVWTDVEPMRTDALDASIRAGNSHYITFTDPDGILRSHPLDLAFLFPDSHGVEFRTEHCVLPEVFLSPAAFKDKLHRSTSDLDGLLERPDFNAQSAMRAYLGFQCIDGSGRAYGTDDIRQDTRHHCTGISVYAG